VNIENFAHFLELSGRRTIKSESGYWYDAGGSIYLSIPHHETRSPTDGEIQALLRKHRIPGVKYSTKHGNRGKPGGVYILRDKEYDYQNLPRGAKRSILDGLEKCSVREISFDYLTKHGMALNLDTLKRQGRSEPLFTRPDRWEQFCSAGRQVEGAGAWGAFVDDQLAAYLVTFIIDDSVVILHSMSQTELMPFHPNHALQYSVVKEMLLRPEISLMCGANVSVIDLPQLRSYKQRMGWEILPVNFVVVFHPMVEALLLGRLGGGLFRAISRLARRSDKLKRMTAIVDMAEKSR
jgi:hypothetical protein